MGATAKAGAAKSGFWCLLDDCFAGDAGQDPSPEGKRPASNEDNRDGEQAAPISLPAQAAAARLAARWGLSQMQNTGAITSALAPEVSTVDAENAASGAGSARGWDSMAGPSAWDLASLRGDPAGNTPTQTLDALPELAFGARLRSPEPVTPAGGTAETPFDPAVAGSSASASPATSEVRNLPADNGRSSASAEISANSLAHARPLDNQQSGGRNGASPGNSQRSSATPEEERNPPTPEQRTPSSPADSATKDALPFIGRLKDDRSEDAPAGHAAAESVCNPLAPSAADPEAQPDVPAQETRVARPAEAEAPEPAAPPVSRDVSLHLAGADSSVDIRMAERAGEIRVTVHTPDHDLANNLRADLPDLVGKLRQSGFQAEVWRPAAAAQSETGRRGDPSASQEHSPDPRRDGRQRQAQQQHPKKLARWAGAWKSSLDPAKESHS